MLPKEVSWTHSIVSDTTPSFEHASVAADKHWFFHQGYSARRDLVQFSGCSRGVSKIFNRVCLHWVIPMLIHFLQLFELEIYIFNPMTEHQRFMPGLLGPGRRA
jgi:hypothetical protein